MRREIGPGPFVLTTILALMVCFTVWQLMGSNGTYEKKANQRYKEHIELHYEGVRTAVVVNGKDRPDCVLQRGSNLIYCRPPLTPQPRQSHARAARPQR